MKISTEKVVTLLEERDLSSTVLTCWGIKTTSRSGRSIIVDLPREAQKQIFEKFVGAEPDETIGEIDLSDAPLEVEVYFEDFDSSFTYRRMVEDSLGITIPFRFQQNEEFVGELLEKGFTSDLGVWWTPDGKNQNLHFPINDYGFRDFIPKFKSAYSQFF